MISKKFIFPIAILILLSLIGYFYWRHSQRYPDTNDAYLSAHIINIAPQISGDIKAVYIQDQQYVQQGQLLFEVNAIPYEIKLNEALAQYKTTEQQIEAAQKGVEMAQAVVHQREAELINIQSESERALILEKKHYYSKSQGDLAIKNLAVAKAALTAAKSELEEAVQKRGDLGDKNSQLQSAQAYVNSANLNLSYTKVYAPASGFIANFDLRKGATVTAYQSLFALIEDDHWWVQANFKEVDLQKIRIGQTTKIMIDMYPHQVFWGKVESIGTNSSASFSILPPENASGNWVKVTQRFPVKIAIQNQNSHFPLRIGASSTVVVDTQS